MLISPIYGSRVYKSHGNYAELNTAAYWMKNLGRNTQRGRFFFGDITSGFMV